MAQIGYTHKDAGEVFYIKYPLKKYPKLISRLTGQSEINKPLYIKFNNTKSVYSLKYALKFTNLFYYKINESNSNKALQLINFNLILSQKNKMIKLVNFDVLPIISLSMNNESSEFPFNLSFKYGKYQASRTQHFDTSNNTIAYDFSKVLKSMLPFKRTGVRISHSKDFEFNLLGKKYVQVMTKQIAAVNRIHGYEDNLKLTSNVKLIMDFYEEFKNLFRLRLINDLTIKKSFIFPHSKKKEDPHDDTNYRKICKSYKHHHVLSGYECHSKILEMNLLNVENVIENGSDFFMQNILTLRLKDLPYLKDKEVLSRINPYFSLETIFLPEYYKTNNNITSSSISNKNKEGSIDWKNSFRFIYSLGFSIAMNDYMHIDLSLYTAASHNTKIKREFLNNFRISLNM